jgi:hypothetical protein
MVGGVPHVNGQWAPAASTFIRGHMNRGSSAVPNPTLRPVPIFGGTRQQQKTPIAELLLSPVASSATGVHDHHRIWDYGVHLVVIIQDRRYELRSKP